MAVTTVYVFSNSSISVVSVFVAWDIWLKVGPPRNVAALRNLHLWDTVVHQGHYEKENAVTIVIIV